MPDIFDYDEFSVEEVDIDYLKSELEYILEDNDFTNGTVFSYIGELLKYSVKNSDCGLRPQQNSDFTNALAVISSINSIFEDYCENPEMKSFNALVNRLSSGDVKILTKEEMTLGPRESCSEAIDRFVFSCNEKLMEKQSEILDLKKRINELERRRDEQKSPVTAPAKKEAPVTELYPTPAPAPAQPEKDTYKEQQFAEDEVLHIDMQTQEYLVDKLNADDQYRASVKKLVFTGDFDCLPKLYDFPNLTELEIGHGIISVMSDSLSKCPSLKLIKVTEPQLRASFTFDMPFAVGSAPELIIAPKGSAFENIAKLCKIDLENN